jgi:ketosteroid isomerase-like protein
MNCIRIFLVMILLFGGVAIAQAGDSIDSSIKALMLRQQEAWNRHDLEGFMSGYWNSRELTFISNTNETSGWQPTLDRYRKSYQGEGHEMGKLEFSDPKIQPLGNDAAFVRGVWKLTMSDGKTPHGLFTLIFKKFPDGWKIIHDHTSGE